VGQWTVGIVVSGTVVSGTVDIGIVVSRDSGQWESEQCVIDQWDKGQFRGSHFGEFSE